MAGYKKVLHIWFFILLCEYTGTEDDVNSADGCSQSQYDKAVLLPSSNRLVGTCFRYSQQTRWSPSKQETVRRSSHTQKVEAKYAETHIRKFSQPKKKLKGSKNQRKKQKRKKRRRVKLKQKKRKPK